MITTYLGNFPHVHNFISVLLESIQTSFTTCRPCSWYTKVWQNPCQIMYNTWVFMNSASSRHPFICKTFPCGCNTGRFVKKSIILVHTKLQRNNFPLLHRFFTRFRCVFSHELSRTPHSKLTSAILFVQRPGWPQRFKVQSLKCVSKYKSFYRDITQNISLL